MAEWLLFKINQILLRNESLFFVTLPLINSLKKKMRNFVEELRWRGMIQDIMPETEQHLLEGLRAAYVGIDPTADSLHIGHLVGVMMLRHFQNCGTSLMP